MVIGLVGSPSLLWAGTWQEVGATYNSGTVYSIGEKTESGKVYRGISKITPTVKDISRMMVRTGVVFAVDLALQQLLKGIDYVLDPEAQKVRFFDPHGGQIVHDRSGKCAVQLFTNTGSYDVWAKDVAKKVREEMNRYHMADYNIQTCYMRNEKWMTCHVQNATQKREYNFECWGFERSISYDDVAQKILDNALADQEEAVDYIFDVAETAVPLERQILDWENTKVVYDPLLTSYGNQADSAIKTAWNDFSGRDEKGKRPDRCDWLKENQHLFPADAVNATEKAWGCRHSRASKDKKDKKR